MDGFLEKISSYNIFNNLFPGALFVYFFERSTKLMLSSDDIIKNIVLYYFIGLVIGRIGSLAFEPFLKVIRIIHFSPYNEYLNACGKDSKIETLQEVANMYRTLFSMSLILLISLFIFGCFVNESFVLAKIISLLSFVLFLVSYVKQVRYIVKRVSVVNQRLP